VIAAARTRWVTFDCFGTLVDWQAGFREALASIAGARTAELVRAYSDQERLAQAERPHLTYKEVLARSLAVAAEDAGLCLRPEDHTVLEHAWGGMPLFADVEPMLQQLRDMGCRLAVLTNCDNDLFALTHARFRERFDLVVTSEQVYDYKPSLSHFRCFDRLSGVGVGQWVHVGCSWYHDITAAERLGIKSVWLDRDDTGDPSTTGTIRVRSAMEVPRTIARL
jgi:2-haloacid dehalogenase